jgi:2-polyprenyl-3-methyl-5-hydroxy-6-metoxy-1,4-benzoquinol methylase
MVYKNIDCWEDAEYSLGSLSSGHINKYKRVMGLMPNKGRILDVGCNNGCLHILLAEAGYTDISGFDFARIPIQIAKKHHPNYDYFVHDACKEFPYDKESFDIVLCVEVLEHVPSPYLVLENMFRVLKPGGCIIVSTPNGLHKEIKKIRDDNWTVSPHVFQYMTPTILKGMIRGTGGKIVFSNPFYRHILIKYIKRESDGIEG